MAKRHMKQCAKSHVIREIQIKTTISSAQLLSRVRLLATPWITAGQASLSITISRTSLRLTSIQSVMPPSHLILCRPLLLLLPIPPSIRVFSSESTLRMRWPKYWSFSLSISPSSEHPGLVSSRMHHVPLEKKNWKNSVSCISVYNLHAWSSNTLAAWRKEPPHWKRPWCGERLKTKGEEGSRGQDGYISDSVDVNHWLNGHEFEQTPGESRGHQSLAFYSPWGRKESDTT